MSIPIVSVVVPVYNNEECLKLTLKSVLKQTFPELEVLVVDDGSEVDILSVINQFSDPRIRYYGLPHTNANVARNYGINKSRGSYIAMLDADDIWLDSHLNDCLDTMRTTNADGLYGSLIIKSVNGNERTHLVRNLNENEAMINYLLTEGYGAQTSTLFLTAQSAKQVLWDNELRRHQDYDFVVRYSKSFNMKAKINPTVIYTVHSNTNNIDFHSCIRFIKQNEDDIHPPIYNNYNRGMLSLALRLQAKSSIIKYYRKQATYYKEYLSYYEYMILRQPQGYYEILKHKFEFLYHIIRVQVIASK